MGVASLGAAVVLPCTRAPLRPAGAHLPCTPAPCTLSCSLQWLHSPCRPRRGSALRPSCARSIRRPRASFSTARVGSGRGASGVLAVPPGPPGLAYTLAQLRGRRLSPQSSSHPVLTATLSLPVSFPPRLCADACPCQVDPAGPNAPTSRSTTSNSTSNSTASGVPPTAGTPEAGEEPRVRAMDGGVTASTTAATEAAFNAGRSAAPSAGVAWQSPSGCCVRPPVSHAFGPSDDNLP